MPVTVHKFGAMVCKIRMTIRKCRVTVHRCIVTVCNGSLMVHKRAVTTRREPGKFMKQESPTGKKGKFVK